MKEKLLKIDKRKTPEHREHLKNIGRKKGQPKIEGSGVKKIPEEVKEAMAAKTMDAVAVMADVMMNSSNDTARVKAAAYFLDPFVPKAATNVNVNHAVSIADMLSQINQSRLKDETKTIDITPHEEPIVELLIEPVVIDRD
ncbi:hypothetical protein [Agrobacterium rosae]|uniref:hypothetical protein n=1 Tax=Agrobacterium rosae TaxID=1972867 RepID=UPI0020335AB6|nr:hypothetical protein [Agrobacterium rosae]MCM2433207.1 hypothetical protein [Agrobacterium rosae]